MHPDVPPAEKARELVESLALKGATIRTIQKQLEKEDLGKWITPFEIEQIMLRAEAVKGILPHQPGTLLPRVIGGGAVLMGFGAMWLGTGGFHVPGRYSPAGYGVIALVLGIVLILKPTSSRGDF